MRGGRSSFRELQPSAGGGGWLWTGGRIGWSCSLCDVRIAPEPPSTSGHAGLARTHSSDEGRGRWEVTSLRHASSSSLGGTTQRHTLAKGGHHIRKRQKRRRRLP